MTKMTLDEIITKERQSRRYFNKWRYEFKLGANTKGDGQFLTRAYHHQGIPARLVKAPKWSRWKYWVMTCPDNRRR